MRCGPRSAVSVSREALGEAAAVLLGRLAVGRGDSLLVVYSPEHEALSRVVAEHARPRAEAVMTMAVGREKRDGYEPPSGVAFAMRRSSVAVLLTRHSLSHTRARVAATRNGTRIASLPGITAELFAAAIPVDYDELAVAGRALSGALSNASRCHVRAPGGTDIRLSLRGRRGISDDGRLQKRGAFGNLPAGEAYIAPLETEAEGRIVLDASLSGWGCVDQPITITVDRGRACRICGGAAAAWLARTLDAGGVNGRVLAELGIGTNPGTGITGNMLADEKTLGTIHFAFGTNTSMGGANQAAVHIDGLVRSPTLELDGRLVLEGGRMVR